MIDRVAKAIDPLAFVIPEDDYPAERSRRGAKQFAAMSAAKRAIEAMREPTETMKDAWMDDFDAWHSEQIEEEWHMYYCMIDAALT